MQFVFLVLILVTLIDFSNSRCNKNGVLSDGSIGICNCFPGFHGYDCSLRVCPASTAWVDFPTLNDSAHANFVECSNMV
jgi:hypothetical protein